MSIDDVSTCEPAMAWIFNSEHIVLTMGCSICCFSLASGQWYSWKTFHDESYHDPSGPRISNGSQLCILEVWGTMGCKSDVVCFVQVDLVRALDIDERQDCHH